MRNALHEACDSKLVGEQVSIVRLLLKAPKMLSQLESRDASGNSALVNAVFNSNVWITRELLLAGALVSDTGIRRGLKDKTAGLSTAYDVALWLYSASLLMDVDQLPKFTREPNNFLYNYFSLKGHYKWSVLLGFQNLWKYNTEMVFRMLQRKYKAEKNGQELTRLKEVNSWYMLACLHVCMCVSFGR